MKTATVAVVCAYHCCNNSRKIQRKISWGEKIVKRILGKRRSKHRRSKNLLLNKTRGEGRTFPPISRSSSTAIQAQTPVMELTDDLVVEILTWLPGKDIGRCKCVCKSWRSIIQSREFLEAYQSRQPGLVLCSTEVVDSSARKNIHDCIRLRFFYSTLWRSQLKEPKEDFSCLYEVSLDSCLDGTTQVVNGLICVCEDNRILSLHNICTGQRMSLPGPLCCDSISTFHLGYDPVNRVYKLLKLMMGEILEAEIMNLRPSTELSSWRKLDYDASGLADLLWENAPCIDPQQMKRNSHIPGAKTFAMDGFLYWYLWPQFMFSFDLNKEKFQWIKIPKDLVLLSDSPCWYWKFVQWMGRLALWVPPGIDNGLRLFVLEDGEGKRWSKICLPVPKWLHDGRTIATGNLVTGELLLINPLRVIRDNHMPVLSYNPHTKKVDGFRIGKLPLNDLKFLTGEYPHPVARGIRRSRHRHFCLAWISCLQDNRFTPLDDVLSGAAAHES
ncbi:OLC1v1022486C1 [Oldenlandia corymbosa var. corymbosa]|uniref:OLC1v1022486C1 n=1 Tax=Oldenlandia corymbosa var. corymbosa TaxID=529605 RepID=A0AAV1BXY0_OLDCO|nr:OLC1v1022486C1 [Oldenlandia corymbosa var. corymbosa]